MPDPWQAGTSEAERCRVEIRLDVDIARGAVPGSQVVGGGVGDHERVVGAEPVWSEAQGDADPFGGISGHLAQAGIAADSAAH